MIEQDFLKVPAGNYLPTRCSCTFGLIPLQLLSGDEAVKDTNAIQAVSRGKWQELRAQATITATQGGALQGSSGSTFCCCCCPVCLSVCLPAKLSVSP